MVAERGGVGIDGIVGSPTLFSVRSFAVLKCDPVPLKSLWGGGADA